MTNNKTTSNEKVSDKKLNRLFIEQKIEEVLSDLKPLVSKKKFESTIKKTSKLLNKSFSKKSLESFRKQYESIHPEMESKDNTSLLIEELP